MGRVVTPIAVPVSGLVTVPGSKSITQRSLVCAALASGESLIRNASDSEDTDLMINGLNQLGILVRRVGRDLVVEGRGGKIHAPKFPIPVGNAGTTLRFLIGVASLADGTVAFSCSERMSQRPLQPLLDALGSLGVECNHLAFADRVVVRGKELNGGMVNLHGDVSSQFLSSLLMVAPYAANDVRVVVEGLRVSDSYVGMTMDVMKQFGVTVRKDLEHSFAVEAGKGFTGSVLEVEPDASAASFFFAAAAILGGEITVRGLRTDSIQGDLKMVSLLELMGCRQKTVETGISVASDAMLRGIDADLRDCPDLAPVVAVLGLFASGRTRVRNTPQLRLKESDRLEALKLELQKLGARMTLWEGGFEIELAPLVGASLNPHGDHRLAMSFALIGCKVSGVIVEQPECVRKSFPGFWEEIAKIDQARS